MTLKITITEEPIKLIKTNGVEISRTVRRLQPKQSRSDVLLCIVLLVLQHLRSRAFIPTHTTHYRMTHADHQQPHTHSRQQLALN